MKMACLCADVFHVLRIVFGMSRGLHTVFSKLFAKTPVIYSNVGRRSWLSSFHLCVGGIDGETPSLNLLLLIRCSDCVVFFAAFCGYFLAVSRQFCGVLVEHIP